MLGGIFQLYSNLNRTFYTQTAENLIRLPFSAASDLVTHCLPVSHKKFARLKWVKKASDYFSLGKVLVKLFFSLKKISC